MTRPASQGSFEFPNGQESDPGAPLAARMRPRTIAEFVGQDSVIGPGSPVIAALQRGRLPSLLLWGPPGCGKTTLARLIAAEVDAVFVSLSAVTSGVAELRQVINDARARRHASRRTIVFIDEIHRFNKAQQDVILPHVEEGVITLIGATTENPSFEVNAPLLSRVRVLRLSQLEDDAIRALLRRALDDPDRGLGNLGLTLDAAAEGALLEFAGGDARAALTLLDLSAEVAASESASAILPAHVARASQDRRPYHDRAGDAHYDTVSAFIKSLRGSDPDAALYWMTRMLEAGEDPLFVVRRMVILAAEDVGLADPAALSLAVACQQAVSFVGLPEAAIPMAECAIYLALAPKSNSAYKALDAARQAARESASNPVPLHLRNAPTRLVRDMGYGAGYRYAHDEPDHTARGATYLPDGLAPRQFYVPGDLGDEARANASWRERQAPSGP